jgi:hypothetical protein
VSTLDAGIVELGNDCVASGLGEGLDRIALAFVAVSVPTFVAELVLR